MTQIKSLDELKDLDKAVFNGETVRRKQHGWFNSIDALDISDSWDTRMLFDIKNWHYAEEEPKPDTHKEPQFGVVYQQKGEWGYDESMITDKRRYQRRNDDGTLTNYVVITIGELYFELKEFWQEWEVAK